MTQSFVLVSCLWGLQLHVEAFHASVGVRRDVRFQSSSFLPSLPSPRFNTISRVPSLWAAEAEDAEPKSTEEETTEPQPTEETIESSDSLENSAANSTSNAVETEKLNIFQRAMKYVRGNKENDGLTFRQRMAKMGLAVVLSYGWVSNMSYCVCMSIAWFIFAKQVRYLTGGSVLPTCSALILESGCIRFLFHRLVSHHWPLVNGKSSWPYMPVFMCSTTLFVPSDWQPLWRLPHSLIKLFCGFKTSATSRKGLPLHSQ